MMLLFGVRSEGRLVGRLHRGRATVLRHHEVLSSALNHL